MDTKRKLKICPQYLEMALNVKRHRGTYSNFGDMNMWR